MSVPLLFGLLVMVLLPGQTFPFFKLFLRISIEALLLPLPSVSRLWIVCWKVRLYPENSLILNNEYKLSMLIIRLSYVSFTAIRKQTASCWGLCASNKGPEFEDQTKCTLTAHFDTIVNSLVSYVLSHWMTPNFQVSIGFPELCWQANLQIEHDPDRIALQWASNRWGSYLSRSFRFLYKWDSLDGTAITIAHKLRLPHDSNVNRTVDCSIISSLGFLYR